MINKGAIALSDEELDNVVGGSHISSGDIRNYVGHQLYYSGSYDGLKLKEAGWVTINSVGVDSDGNQFVNVTLNTGNINGMNNVTRNSDGTYNIKYTKSTFNYLEE